MLSRQLHCLFFVIILCLENAILLIIGSNDCLLYCEKKERANVVYNLSLRTLEYWLKSKVLGFIFY